MPPGKSPLEDFPLAKYPRKFTLEENCAPENCPRVKAPSLSYIQNGLLICFEEAKVN